MGESFPKILSGLRHEKGLNQRTAAAALNISQALLSHYENGLREPGLDFIRTVCRYYGVSSDYLLGLSFVRTPLTSGADGSGGLPQELSEMLASVFSELLRALSACGSEDAEDALSGLLSVFFYDLMGGSGGSDRSVPEEAMPALCDACVKLCRARLVSAEGGPEFKMPEKLKKAAEAELEVLDDYWR
ncbi:MAG: helix-turn-helix transcriptional regulator [Oscillospiraceae bacterium]|nr:helix-turn-helix transcriptional regulator [Oscillospiraceae bacterium]